MDDVGTRLATTFADVARALLSDNDLDSVLNRIAAVAVEEVGGCESAGIDLIEKQVVRCVAWTSETARQMGEIQNEAGEGPCLSAIREHETFRSDDLEHEDRWPQFAQRARTEMDVRSMLGFRLFAEEDTMGALNLHSSKPDAFDDRALAIGSILAAHAGIAMSWAREREYMATALENRDVIGQAKGLLMAQRNVDADGAFALLRAASQRLNIKLIQVAERLTDPAGPGIAFDE
ncbi:MAG TPA: GAF and ANTAR domain-containing protein [Acidimicrobiales bacterium]|nr:GAF and ANTAR domain-containing protein [Acidimicrobiales bacterium]